MICETILSMCSFIPPAEEISQTIAQAISGDFMGRLIIQPAGNGEQNMIYMTLPLIATHYLDSTNQWEAVGMERRNEAINHISTGQRNTADIKIKMTNYDYLFNNIIDFTALILLDEN